MKVCIIGAGRTRNGIGEYIGKYFHKHGGNVTSILGTTGKTSLRASSTLQKYGIEARSYTDFDRMVTAEKPDAAVIASPSSTHYGYLLRCIDSGLHIFCEKPFIWDDGADLLERVEDILGKARRKGATIAMNSQWPFSVDAYEGLCGKISIERTNSFFIRMSPFSPGKTMIPESVPHAFSLLYCLLGSGDINDLHFESKNKGEMNIRFSYLFGKNAWDVLIRLVHQETPPRAFSFGFNEKIVSRRLDPRNYEIYFDYGDKTLKIADPLERSVKDFMEAVEEGREPLIGHRHILHNMRLLEKISQAFETFEKGNPWKS